jgi:hypothetical protein
MKRTGIIKSEIAGDDGDRVLRLGQLLNGKIASQFVLQ